MKFCWVLALLVGCAIAKPSYKVQHGEERKVSDLLEDLIEELDLRDLLDWFAEMIQTDPDVQRIVEYLQGPEFKKIIEHLKTCPGYQDTKEELAKEGIDLAEMLQKVRDWLSGQSRGIKPRRTLGELLNDFLGKLDLQKIMAVIKDKIANDPDMKKVINFLHSEVFKGIVECMRQSPEVQDLIEKLKEEDIDVHRLIEMIKAIFGDGSRSESRKISDLLESIIEETGIAALLPWFEEMVQNDPDVQRIIEYLQGPKFQKIIAHLQACPGYQETKEDLLKEGIDLVAILEKVRDWLSGQGARHIQGRRTLGELLNEFLSKIDLQRVLEVVKDKIAHDPDMKKVIDFLKGEVFKGIVDCMKESPEVQDLIEKLKEEGIDVHRLVEMIKILLGASKVHHQRSHSRRVVDLIKDLIDEMGLAELLPWLEELIRSDPDVQELIAYLKGDAFKRIVAHLRGCPGYQETKEELANEGIDLAITLEKIRDWLAGISGSRKASRSLGELLQQLLSRLDIQKIIAILQDKIQNDPDMKKVIAFLKSDVFKGLTACMRDSADVQDLLEKLREQGIDVERIIEMIKMFLGTLGRQHY